MAEVTIREAAKRDGGAISRVFAASWRHTYHGQIDQRYLDGLRGSHWTRFLRGGLGRGELLVPVAVDGERIVGAAVGRASEIQRFPDDAELACLYLLPEYIGCGAGRALLDRVEAMMRERGFSHSALDVLDSNDHAIQFYLRNGYEITPHRVALSLGASDLECYLMRKAL